MFYARRNTRFIGGIYNNLLIISQGLTFLDHPVVVTVFICIYFYSHGLFQILPTFSAVSKKTHFYLVTDQPKVCFTVNHTQLFSSYILFRKKTPHIAHG